MEPLVYTREEMQELFGDVSERTLHRWVKQGKLPEPFVAGRWWRCEIHALIPRKSCDKSGQDRQSEPTADSDGSFL